MQTVVGLYDRIEDAYHAVDALVQSGISRDRVGVVARDVEGKYAGYLKKDSLEKEEDVSQGAAAGASLGAVVGGLGGLLAGLGALLIPGIGPVIAAGPLVSALVGAGVGATAGGVLGALVDLGIPEDTASIYAEGVRRGGTLVYTTVDDTKADKVLQILNRFNPIDINQRAEDWRVSRWSGFDPASNEWTTEEIEQERSRYSREMPVTGERVMTGLGVEETNRAAVDWPRYETMFRQDYQTRYGLGGHDFDYYMPAYRYGYELRSDPRFIRYNSWPQVEAEARRDWQSRGEISTWDEVKDAVRHAWESITR